MADPTASAPRHRAPRATRVDARHEPILQFQDVHKSFGDKVVYEGLNLDVYEGEVLTIIGGSGVGKSVLLKLLLGLLQVDSGSILAFGEDVTTMGRSDLIAIRHRIAMLFQGGALFDSMTVEQNLKYPLLEHGWTEAERIDARVEEVLTMVGLPGIRRLMPAELSGGMRKRVGLARAIAVSPDVILYDEPTTGLDPINVRRINGMIRDLQARLGVTSVVVTHDMDSAFTVADRFAMVHERRIAWVGSREETEHCELPFVRDFVAGGRGVLRG